MKILFINSVCGIGSTGRICTTMAQEYESQGHEVKIAYGRAENVPEQYKEYAVRIGKTIDMKLHAVRTRILDEHGLGSIQATRNFLKWADDYNPDLLWLHNIHGYYINYELLFAWIKEPSEHAGEMDAARLLGVHREMRTFYAGKMREVESRLF